MNDFSNIYEDAKRAMDGTSAAHMQEPQVVNKTVHIDDHAEHSTSAPSTTITIILPTNAYFMSGVRDFTMSIVQNMTGFPEKWAFRFQSIVDELCNNAIEHGSEPGQDVKVTFKSIHGESIEVTVSDTGTGPSQKSGEEMYTLISERKSQLSANAYSGIRGRGLAQIVSNWTDELTFDTMPGGGLRVTVVKRLENIEGNQ